MANIQKQKQADNVKTQYGFLYVGLKSLKETKANPEEVERRALQRKYD
jgi:hypothetical protein